MRLYAPRILNEPVRWRFSAFSCTSRPTSRDSVSEPYTGVTRATPSRRARAASMSVTSGAVTVNFEDLFEDLAHRTERVELAPLHRIEHTPQLRVVPHRVLDVLLRPRGGDREHLAGEIAPTALVELPGRLEILAVLCDLLPQLGHVLTPCRLGEHDRGPPRALAVESEDRADLVQHRLRGGMIHLVDRDHVWNLHDSRLQRLHRVAGARHEHEQHGVGDPDHLDLALARPHSLEEDELLARRVEDEQRLQRGLGQAAEMAARPHRADEDAGVEEVV